jgi:tRNA-modifying protein YgfZ
VIAVYCTHNETQQFQPSLPAIPPAAKLDNEGHFAPQTLDAGMNDWEFHFSALELCKELYVGAVLIDLGPRTEFTITGADRVNFLHSFCTADIKKLQPGQGVEAFITNHQGKAVGHVQIFGEPERLVLCGAAGQAEKLIAHLDRFVISERLEFQDISAAQVHLLLAGPHAAEVIARCGIQPPAERLQNAAVNLTSHSVSLRNVDYLATTPCYLFSVPVHAKDQVIQALIAAGAKQADELASALAWEMARIEAGYPLYGHDITEDNLPQEVARDAQAINFNKGCYLGQETIARLDALGHVNRVLTGLKFLSAQHLEPGEVIMQGDKKLAQITSLTLSPKLNAPLALAYVRTLHATAGKRLAFPGGEAEVVKLPLEGSPER